MSQLTNELTAAEAAQRIARKELTSEALVRACLERIRARDDKVEAWEYVDVDLALAQARERDREPARSALHGVPVGIKDVLDTFDMPSEYGSPIYRGNRPKADASCVALLRRAGCVILGKTVTTEFANVHPQRTRNPHHLDHMPGGSSSGSAAGVADRMVPLALGTQTGGSTIRPAAYCGVVGMKPTFNAINRAGLKFSAESLDTIGIIARTVEDVALAFGILTDRDADVGGRPARPALIGLCRTPRWNEADEGSRANLERAAEALMNGGRVSDHALPAGFERLFSEHGKIAVFEAARALASEHANHQSMLSGSILDKIDEGWRTPRSEYDAARALVRDCRARFDAQMSDCDFLLTLSAPDEPGKLSQTTTGSSVFNRIWTWLGVPCITLPFGRGPNGLPLGVQLIGRADRDAELLHWAHWAAERLR
jgi:Asp-tRNA(Asn)/Glu-tRNA(Gln) amidotransferase A subunit family amidase